MNPIQIVDLLKILNAKLEQPGKMKAVRHISIDSRAVKKGDLFIAIRGEQFDGHDFVKQAVENGAAGILISRRVDTLSSAITVIRVKEDTTRALGKIAAFYRQQFKIPVIAVTGSAGKTTTKELLAQVLSTKYRVLKNYKSYNNFWGVPLTLLNLSAKHDAAVIEVGTNHPGEIAYLTNIVRPTVAVLTNVGLAHLQGFKNLESVFKEKRSLLQGLSRDGVVIFNRDDQCLKRLSRLKRRAVSFGRTKGAGVMADDIRLDQRGDVHFCVNRRHVMMMKTPVMENVLNGLAAVACARLFGIPFSKIRVGLRRAKFQQSRQQIERFHGYTVINDSYNANPVSFRSALNTLQNFPTKGRRIVVCGDMLELGKRSKALHREIGVLIGRSSKIDGVYSFGLLAGCIAHQAKKIRAQIDMKQYREITALQRDLKRILVKGDVVLIKGSRGMRMERVTDFLRS
ncbi:MAG TPA: UDP-N-acetylmuramoyl-tripeptide--D-alanyl-D-alanine ligase [Candidatus Bathyarchaeia archaeon]|nr:UDP-N-acetylmuramoyl-tripeptide--D-alanyl-D-alanine ligase [Candidatus Bathyarchaeia archaeon]